MKNEVMRTYKNVGSNLSCTTPMWIETYLLLKINMANKCLKS